MARRRKRSRAAPCSIRPLLASGDHLLREAGVSDADIERISGPSGLDIGADSPAETAVSMLAEMLAVRAGRSGGRLKEATTRIHAERVA